MLSVKYLSSSIRIVAIKFVGGFPSGKAIGFVRSSYGNRITLLPAICNAGVGL